MEATTGSGDRNKLFQELKPYCVRISQLAIRESDEPSTHRELLTLTNQLLAVLTTQVATNPLALDEKLAEYVFFPLYHVFRQMERYPMPLVESCTQCLNLLIVHGWKSRISSQLVRQIFSLLTFIIAGVPGSGDRKERPEETVLEAFRAETALLDIASTSPLAATGLSDPQAIPDLGHGITVILDGVVDGATPDIQKEALRALVALHGAIRDNAALANFLPGTISSITKVLSSPARYKKLVLSKCLEAVRAVLTRVLGDLRTRAILAQKNEGGVGEGGEVEQGVGPPQVLSAAWLKATAARVKTALSIMMKMRTHDAPEVREALRKLCIGLLSECHSTLSNCTSMLVETAMILNSGNDVNSLSETSLSHLVDIYPELGESAKDTIYNWMSSLPRMMQSSDQSLKEAAVHNLTKGINMLKNLRIESSVLEDSISNTLRDSVISLISSSKEQPLASTSTQILLLDEAQPGSASSGDLPYQPVLLGHEGQRRLRGEILNLLQTIGASSQHFKIALNLLESAREPTSSVDQVTAFWLCFELVKAAHSSSSTEGELLDLSAFADFSEGVDAVFNDLYSFSLLLLDSHQDTHRLDWHLEAIALEVVAYSAQRSGQAFRPELIDVLFPVATFLGSENANLRQHAVATLGVIATSCQYGSVSELIVENVDYMVNSVSLRLNTLDISPASTQVLLMIVRLSGPRLVPFLDDVVESIFAALQNYHGYQAFVESLFSVLKEVVDQASRADGKLLADGERTLVNHKKEPRKTDGLDRLSDYLDQRKTRDERDGAEAEAEGISFDQRNFQTPSNDDGDEEDGQQAEVSKDEDKKPNSPTYRLLQKITYLTQHYMTSPTPALRRSLLELLATASPILAADEDSFLPLVNAIWPVVITRLRDSEAFVTIEACHALSELCETAGDFLSTRFKTEWWDGLGDWCRTAKKSSSGAGGRPPAQSSSNIKLPFSSVDKFEGKAGQVETLQGTSGRLGQYASSAKIWEAVVKLLTSIVSYVRVEEEIFDEILDLLVDVMERNSDVREALEVINSDAVWLARRERGLVEWNPPVRQDEVSPE